MRRVFCHSFLIPKTKSFENTPIARELPGGQVEILLTDVTQMHPPKNMFTLSQRKAHTPAPLPDTQSLHTEGSVNARFFAGNVIVALNVPSRVRESREREKGVLQRRPPAIHASNWSGWGRAGMRLYLAQGVCPSLGGTTILVLPNVSD